ncbi:PREDICTED: epithelial-stromal interaction protein 1 [Cyprinodon variegatus]|uniref:Epithelial stromal interaction 1 n=1 Tax=Cyprinodon variegatus TaxID=28743 RepID=A0A3Q2DN80_CYPVA|nr:PREDICTED: epithelial-stromal interaction protein 1 [Cyprinodon variegatus]
MDPHQNRRGSGRQQNSRGRINPSGAPGPDQAAPNLAEPAAESQNQAAADSRQPQYLGAFTVIPPNQSRRNEIKAMAQKEEEELQRYKEANRPSPLQLNPERLGGGDVSLDEARQRQLTQLRSSKLQKKLKEEEAKRKKKQEEEEELQRMKDIQREKSERLEEKRKQEDEERRRLHQQDRIRSLFDTELFLSSACLLLCSGYES